MPWCTRKRPWRRKAASPRGSRHSGRTRASSSTITRRRPEPGGLSPGFALGARPVPAAADVILDLLVGGIEGLADGHRKIRAGLLVDRDLRIRERHVDADPDAPPQRMIPRAVHRHPASLDALEEVTQLLGPLLDVHAEPCRHQLR